MVAFNEKKRFIDARAVMVRNQLKGRDITDDAVLEVMARLPREEFISPKYADQAYEDYPVPIGMGQTISQPYIVALMTQQLRLNEHSRVLELGTGCGYQTAILAGLAKKIYTIERHNQLSETAQAVLARIGIKNVEYYIGDGSKGWPGGMLFDRIIITAAVPAVPQTLTDQLCENGIIVVPVGDTLVQSLTVYEKKTDRLHGREICGCRFVKLIGKYAFDEAD